ncbi:HAD-IA family hydrolase [Pelomyxa schiedti]|nr:HAD-IA family hydrolase [Pelomyxa schiedti]
MPIKALVWDLGGVVFRDGKEVAYPELAKNGFETKLVKSLLTSFESNQVRKGLMDEDQFWSWTEQQLREHGQNTDTVFLKKTWYESYLPIEPVWDLMRRVRSHYQMVCFTGNIPSRIAYLQQKYNFEELFDLKLYSYDYHMSKSQPQFFQALIEKCGCAPNEIMLLDDEEKHKVVANSVGVNCIVFKGDTDDMIRQLAEFGVN